MNTVKITCISENTSLNYSLLAQHGQSLHINYFGSQYLFDTAEIYEGFAYNIAHLGIALEDQKAIILSHRHLDHMGSIPKLLKKLTQPLYITNDYQQLEEKGLYSSTYRQIAGKTLSVEEVISSILSYSKVLVTKEGQEFEKGLYTTGSLGKNPTEQSLVVNISEKGIVIIVGCSHPTLPVIVEKAKQITGINHVYGIIGGLHYKDMQKEEITQNVDYLESLELDFIVPSHCTGFRAIRTMQDKLGEKVKSFRYRTIWHREFSTNTSRTCLSFEF